MGRGGRRRRPGGKVGGARAPARRLARPPGVAALPRPRASSSRDDRGRRRRCSASTTGSTSSPTTARPSRPSSRCSPSSPAPTTTCGRSRFWPWSSRCSRPGTCAPAPTCSSPTSATCPPPRGGDPAGRRHAPGGVVLGRGHRRRQHRLPPHRLVRAGAAAGRRGPARASRCGPSRRGAVAAGSAGPWRARRHQPVPAARRRRRRGRPRRDLRRLRRTRRRR